MSETAPKQQKTSGLGGARPGSGRKQIGVQRAIILPDDIWNAAGERARQAGMKRPDWLRHVIGAAVKQRPNDSDTAY